ncbi:cation:proton antiporter [Microbacterium esteraromaticum]|uniref:cation:proton antiporter n=1 Tax=Microbacterium esteraromaticum TaxID=57043 RepID=UPI00195E2237|nr:cation:proton antiporter [Microbacterium esteraromaticum]MBM7465582.1 CPA1 family monovalent cation:H+ antiporter [Microbacterium esteraromaticum]
MESSIFFIVVGAVAVAAVARWKGWPAPLLVTVVALLASFLPFVPDVAIDGHVLLNIVLPPLLYSAALDVSFLSFRRAMPQIRRLGVGLVVVTAGVVGLLAWWIMPELTLPGALLLGAIVAPPDAVSAAAIGRRLGLPRRVMTVLSGESLINDATSLTMYRVFAAIVAGATVTLAGGVGQFFVAVLVGVAVGLAFGAVLHGLRMRVADPVVNGTFGLLAPFGAYAIAEQLLGSGVLAVVAMGLFVGFNAPKTSYATRQQEAPLWLSADFLLESFVFAYIGLQLPRVIADLKDGEVGGVVLLSAVVLAAVLVVRPLFVYPAHAWGQWWTRMRLRRWKRIAAMHPDAVHAGRPGRTGRLSRHPLSEEQLRHRLAETRLSWRDNAVISWAGMRGVVTLATALAAADLAGMDGAAAHAIVVVAFVVTVGTLLLQGLTLPWLIRTLGVVDDREQQEDARQLAAVRERSREAGKAYLRGMRREWAAEHGEERLPAFDAYAKRLVRVQSDAEQSGAEKPGTERGGGDQPLRPTAEQFTALAKGWLAVRRQLLLEERRAGNLSEEVMHELIAAMDAEELALDTRIALRT